MDKIILAIETSCDETAVAILKNESEILANVVSSQIKQHQENGGVMPELASRLHIKNITFVIDQALEQASIKMSEVDYIAFTKGPGLAGCLHVGSQAAKTLALIYKKPLIAVNHIAAHIYANHLYQKLEFPLLSLVVSGGHSEFIYMKDHLHFEKVGQTLDDAVGECYDKVARLLGLGYPGGPVIDKQAKLGIDSYDLPLPLNDGSLNFSFSGLKSAVLNLVNTEKMKKNEIRVADLCCSFQNRVVEIIRIKTLQALKLYPTTLFVIAGGVAANSQLREMVANLQNDKYVANVICPPLWCCTDNAIMVAQTAYFIQSLQPEKIIFDYNVTSNENMKIEEM